MRKLLLILTLLSGCRDVDQLRPVPPCEPYAETCNGYDDDCDGAIDEDTTVQCESACESGYSTCVQGRMSECSARKPVEETCNGLDDDCDGFVDNEEVIGVAPCYPGNTTDLLHGECRWGVKRCMAGHFACSGAVIPIVEECNGKDDDCDGQVDDGTGQALDLVFAVDYSGSMSDRIQLLATVTAQWASKYSSRTDLKMALVGIPDDTSSHDGYVTVTKNLDTPAAFSAAINQHQDANGGGNEPSIDVVWLLSHENNPLGMTWTPGSRRAVVVYTDELPQSYLSPAVTEVSAISAAQAAGVRVFVFTSESTWYQWNPKPFPTLNTLEQELDQVVSKGSCQ